MNLSSIIAGVLAVADKIAPLVIPGAAPEILAVAHAAAGLVQNTISVAGTTDQAALTQRLDTLRDRVNAHAAATIASLG